MGYQQAVEKAWDALSDARPDGREFRVKLLSDNYTINIDKRTILSDSCNVPAKEYVAIILLHYLARKTLLKGLPPPTGEWIDFKELEGGEGYYPAFKKRTIDRIIKKSDDKEDSSTVINVFEEIPIMITTSKADEEFGPDANILFDKNISSTFCTEDIVVLAELVTHQL